MKTIFVNFDLNDGSEHEWSIRFYTARLTVMTVRKFSKKKKWIFFSTSIWMIEVNMNDQYASSLQGWLSWELENFQRKKNEFFFSTSIWMIEVNMNDQYASSLQGWPSWELENFQRKKNEIFFFNFDLNDWSEHEWSICFFTARLTVMRVRKFSKKKKWKFFFQLRFEWLKWTWMINTLLRHEALIPSIIVLLWILQSVNLSIYTAGPIILWLV